MYFSTVFWSQVEIGREYFAPSAFKYFRRSWYLWGGALGKKLNFNRIISDLLLAEFNQNYSTKAEGFLGFFSFLLQELNVSQKKRNPLVTLSLSQTIPLTVH